MTRDPKKSYEWDKKNKYIFSVGLMRETDADIIGYLEDKREKGISRNSIVKEALRNQMKEDSEKG